MNVTSAPANAEPVVEFRELSKRFGRIQAIDGLSFQVPKGSLFGFLGPNGAGKSTSLYILAGLVKPTSGSIRLFGCESQGNTFLRSRIGVMIETPAFYEFLSARKNLQLVARLHSAHVIGRERIDEVLETVGLSNRADDRVSTFSHGMKQRLGLAQAILHEPELLILDEPSNGLDPEGNQEMWHLLKHLAHEERATVLVSSHLLYEVEQYCEQVAVINHGRLIATGSVQDLLDLEDREVAISFANLEALERAKKLIPEQNWPITIVDDDEPDSLALRVNLQGEPLMNMTSWLRDQGLLTTTVVPVQQTLRDLFMKLMTDGVSKE